jgi:hypothetical protein
MGTDSITNQRHSALFVYTNGGGTGIYRTGHGCTVSAPSPVCNPQPVGPEFLQHLLGQLGGQYRQVSVEEFERITGLDLIAALRLLQTHGGFEQFQDIVTKAQQDRGRPGEAPQAPPRRSCSYSYSCY